MDCCEKKNEEKHNEKNVETPAKSDNGLSLGKVLLALLLVSLIIFSVYEALQVNALKQAQNTQTQQGESYDEMMQRMHPEQAKPSQSTGNQMVGGC